MGEDREKKSWRERDQAASRSSHRREERPDFAEERKSRSGAYRSYKSQLNKVFEGGGLPDALKEKLAEAGIGQDSEERKAKAQAILDAAGASALLAAFEDYRARFDLPDDEEVLAKLLELDQEPEILVSVLERLGQLSDEGALKRAAALKQRVKALLLLCDDDDVYDAAQPFT